MESTNKPEASITDKALQLVTKHKGQQDLVFVAEEDLRTQAMFLPEVVIIHSTPDDFHNISGKFMPKSHQTNRIGEAAGIDFLEKNCGTRAEQIDGNMTYVGFAQAKKRMPDGTWRTSSICEYEFNPVLRAEEDFFRDTKDKYKTEKNRQLAILNYKKFGRARASTGARLRVVRELTGMPIAFKPEQIKRAMVFCRIAVNTDLLLSDPATQEAAVKAALGVQTEIYGPPKEEPKALTDGVTIVETNGDQEPAWGKEEKPAETEEEKMSREMLEDLTARREKYNGRLPDDAKAKIDAVLANPDDQSVNGMIEQFDEWESKLPGGGK